MTWSCPLFIIITVSNGVVEIFWISLCLISNIDIHDKNYNKITYNNYIFLYRFKSFKSFKQIYKVWVRTILECIRVWAKLPSECIWEVGGGMDTYQTTAVTDCRLVTIGVVFHKSSQFKFDINLPLNPTHWEFSHPLIEKSKPPNNYLWFHYRILDLNGVEV